MISTEKIELPEFDDINLKLQLKKLYIASGIPVKYHFQSLETGWSTVTSPVGKLTGSAKKRSEIVKVLFEAYIKALDSIMSGEGLRVVLKDRVEIVSDLFIDGKKSSGKSFLLSVIGQESIIRGYKVKYIDWVDYLDRFQTFESRDANEEYFQHCINCDLLIVDSVYDYNINTNRYFLIQFDRLISNRQNSGKTTICSVDTSQGMPVFGPVWNRFSRETYTIQLPEPSIKS